MGSKIYKHINSINETLMRVLVTKDTVKSGKYYILWLFVFVAFGIQHEMRSRLIIFSSAAYLAVKYLSTLSHKRPLFSGEKKY